MEKLINQDKAQKYHKKTGHNTHIKISLNIICCTI